eukprot:jgi/Chrzof1/12677/Cz07g03130.t1
MTAGSGLQPSPPPSTPSTLPSTPQVSSSHPLSSSQQAHTPPSSLASRQWRRAAQRALRLAVTIFKDARSRFNDASSAGTQAATQLTNAVLSAKYLPDMPMGVLEGVQDLRDAAAAKLRTQQCRSLTELEARYEDMEAAVQVVGATASKNSCIQALDTGVCPRTMS